MLKKKIKVSLIHLSLSLLVFVLITLGLVFFLYPSFYFGMSGGWQGLMLMFFVDVILGPAITFIVFNPRKARKETLFEFCIIGVIQISALGYGLMTVYKEHPGLVVFYENGTATALTTREVDGSEKLSAARQNAEKFLEGVPVAFFRYKSGEGKYYEVTAKISFFDKLDLFSRKFMGKNELKKVAEVEELQGKIFVISVMGKYTGSYVFIDKELKYLGKVGEKDVM